MKTFKELFEEIVKSDEMKDAYTKAVKAGDEAVEAFLKANGCEAKVEDIQNFFKEQTGTELTEEEMQAVAGGCIDLTPHESSILPWQCNPHYSSIFDENGNIQTAWICA